MLSLRPWQWDILFALDGRTPLIDVVREMGVETSVASEALQAFHEQGLITVRTMRIEEYAKSAAPFALPPVAPKASPPALAPMPEAKAAPASVPSASLPPPMPAMPRMENVVPAPPPAGGVAFSLKPPTPASTPPVSMPSPGSVPDEKPPSSGSIGFKIK